MVCCITRYAWQEDRHRARNRRTHLSGGGVPASWGDVAKLHAENGPLFEDFYEVGVCLQNSIKLGSCLQNSRQQHPGTMTTFPSWRTSIGKRFWRLWDDARKRWSPSLGRRTGRKSTTTAPGRVLRHPMAHNETAGWFPELQTWSCLPGRCWIRRGYQAFVRFRIFVLTH